ncbi:hypothetical protein JZ751_006319 [Albula glossodonta]|uniref:Uncharacterized protein n=1 Tax=Albula glossodonta TaxID=121402 RepID=A0A8T2NB57_9TELE|nr:hypothetical protein JZ751_006319 [Albula glossodonta]
MRPELDPGRTPELDPIFSSWRSLAGAEGYGSAPRLVIRDSAALLYPGPRRCCPARPRDSVYSRALLLQTVLIMTASRPRDIQLDRNPPPPHPPPPCLTTSPSPW